MRSIAITIIIFIIIIMFLIIIMMMVARMMTMMEIMMLEAPICQNKFTIPGHDYSETLVLKR